LIEPLCLVIFKVVRMFVYFTDGTCINDSEIYGVKAKHEQNKYVVEVTIKPTHVLTTTVSVQFKKEVFDDPNLANQYLNHNFNMPPYF
jgi:hypothetical protein